MYSFRSRLHRILETHVVTVVFLTFSPAAKKSHAIKKKKLKRNNNCTMKSVGNSEKCEPFIREVLGYSSADLLKEGRSKL